MNRLIITVGLPYSGKSTWSKSQPYTVVNRDSVRWALHGQRFLKTAEEWVALLTDTMVRSLFLSGNETIIVDECNITKKRRDKWLSDNNAWKTEYIVFPTSYYTCRSRALRVNDKEILPVIDRMANEWEWPDKYIAVYNCTEEGHEYGHNNEDYLYDIVAYLNNP